MGWFRDTGAWIGDKVQSATDTVGQWAEDTAQVAKDAWDVATSTSVGMEDGSVYLETDLDELSDLMSPETRAALALDRATADNRVRITYSRSTGELVATSDEIALAGIDTPKVKAGQVVLSGVRAVFTNKGGGVPGLGEDFSLFGYKDAADNLQAVVTVASARAVDVQFQGPNGPSTVDTVSLEGLSGTVGAQGGMPFAEAGTTEVDFALEHAVLEGLSANGHTVASAEATGVTAGMSGSNESAFLAADALTVAGVSGENSAGNAQVNGLRVDVDNRGGGLLGVDNTADRARARVAVEAASVTDLDTSDFDADSLTASGFSGEYDTTTGMGQANVRRLGTDGLDTSWVDANNLEARGLSLDGDLAGRDGRRNANLNVGTLTGDGLTVQPTTDGRSASAAGGMPFDYSGNLGSADLTNVHVGGAEVARVQASSASVSGSVDGDASGMRAEMLDTRLTGLAHDSATADSIQTTNTTLTADASSLSATADHVQAANLQTESLRAGDLSAWGGTASFTGDTASASLTRARMTDATLMDRVDIASAQLDQLSGSRSGSSATMSLGSGSIHGVSDRVTGASVDAGSLSGAAVDYNGESGVLTGQLGAGQVSGVQGMGGSLDSASVQTVALSHGPGNSNVSVGQANASGLAYGDSRLDSATASGLTAARQDGTDSLGIASLGLHGARHGDSSLESATIGGITASQAGASRRFGADTAQLTHLAHGDTSVASVTGQGLSGAQDATGIRGGADTLSAQNIRVGDTATVASAHANGLAVAHQDSGTVASVTSAGLSDARFTTDSMRGSLDSATIQAGAVSRSNSGGITGGAESIGLSGLSARGTMSGGSSGGSSGVDTARAIETTAAQVRDAELAASLNLRGGDLGVAGLTAKPNTRVDAGVSIRNGQVQDQGTGVNLSSPIDGPVWTSVKGAYMDDGRLKADVKGWFDQDVTGQVNDALGVDGKRLPSVATMGTGVANMMRQPSSGGSSSGPGLGQIVDMNSVRVDANAQLGDGVIDAGVGRVDLGRAQRAGDNRIDVSASNGSLEADIQRFLLDSTQYASGGTRASTGQTTATGIDLGATERGWSLDVDELNARDVSGSRS